MRDGLAHLTDSDLWEQRAQAADPGGSGPWHTRHIPGTGPLTCMAEWYRSTFGPNLTELAGSLTPALRVKATSELSLRGLILKE